MPEPTKYTADASASPLGLTSAHAATVMEQAGEGESDVRQRVLALRQLKKQQLSTSPGLNVPDVSLSNSDRLTWCGVDKNDAGFLQAPSSASPQTPESRYSDDEEDAESTILGHFVHALPLPPRLSLHLESSQQPRSFSAPDEVHTSRRSTSSPNNETDAQSLYHTTATGSSIGSPSRRPSSARAGITSAAGPTSACAFSKPLGPPPSLPLPARPMASTPSQRSPRSPSIRNGRFGSTRRSSRASSRSSFSVRSSLKSNPSLNSSHLIPTPSERGDTSDFSDEELVGIRDISKQFPSPTPAFAQLPSPVPSILERKSSLVSIKSKSSSRSSRPDSCSRSSVSEIQRALSPVQDTPMDFAFDSPHARPHRNNGISVDDDSDSADSAVLHLTNNKGILAIGERFQPPALHSGVGVARVGLGAKGLQKQASEQLLRRADSVEYTAYRHPAFSQDSEVIEVMRDVEHKPDMPREHRSHHKRSGTMTRSMSELVAALDLEASEWGHRLGQSESTEPERHPESAIKVTQSQHDRSEGPGLPVSDSMPSLSSSGSQDFSLDDSQGPTTAESSLIRSDSAKSVPLHVERIDAATDVGARSEFRSIYDAYRGSTSTLASRFTAPVVRIEDPQGGELTDSELDGDVSSSDDAPKKRSKSRKRIGFEEQRVVLRPRPSIARRSASHAVRSNQTYPSTLGLPEERTPATTSAPATTASEGADPYAFYEFSPSLPPFMPTGLSPLDLTGRGTWSSIAARASERMLSRQPSIASLATVATDATGPVSMRQIRVTAKAKQREMDEAHRAREEMSDQIAAMSYRPFAIHDHALSFATHARMTVNRASVSSLGIGSVAEGTASGRSSSMSSVHDRADSIAPSVGEYGTRWPVAVGADQGIGPDDAASIFAVTPRSSSRQSLAKQNKQKVYVEFSMQTSPQSSPVRPTLPLTESLTLDAATSRSEAGVGNDTRPTSASSTAPRTPNELNFLGIDAPLRRRKSAISLISMHGLDAELDKPGLWPSRIRAPRLSSHSRRFSDGENTIEASAGRGSVLGDGSDEESDLNVDADLQDLAERSGVLDVSRGSKRKLPSTSKDILDISTETEVTARPIASIPARSQRIAAVLDRIRAQRVSRSAGWADLDDEDDNDASTMASRRPSAEGKPPSKGIEDGSPLRGSKSMVSVSTPKRAGSTPSPLALLRMRSPSPELSILTTPSDDEEVLLTEEVEIESTELAHRLNLDEDFDDFDTKVGQLVTSRFSTPNRSALRRASSEASGTRIRTRRHKTASNHDEEGAAEHGGETSTDSSDNSNRTAVLRTRSRSSSTGSAIELIQEADDLTSSTGHSIGHSSGHGTNISTNGHDPQQPNQVLADIIRHRLSMRKQGAQPPFTLLTSPSATCDFTGKSSPSSPIAISEKDEADANSNEQNVPSVEDTPNTTAGSEIWSSFHADRSSTASTATTWSYRSTDDARPRVLSNSSAEALPDSRQRSLASTKSAIEELSAPDASVFPKIVSSEEETLVEGGAVRTIPVLRRKSSGLPVVRTASKVPQAQKRPSLPLAYKPDPSTSKLASVDLSKSAIPSAKPALRRYQSVAVLRPRTADTAREGTAPRNDSAGQNSEKLVRYSDGYRATAPKVIRSVGVTPSKLPSLRSVASTTSLRATAATESSPTASTIRKPTSGAATVSGIPQRLPRPSAAGRSRLPSPIGPRASGLTISSST